MARWVAWVERAQQFTMKESSVSPDRCEVITPQPAFLAILTASMASVTVPI